MKARIADFLFIGQRRGRLTLDLDGDFRSLYDKYKDKEIDIEIKTYRPARSLDANAYCWTLIHRISEKMKREPIVVYREFIRDFSMKTRVCCVEAQDAEQEIHDFVDGHLGRMVDVGDSKLPGCVVLHKKYGSSSFSVSQMSKFIDVITEQCRELGIDTKTPEEIESLLKGWN